MKPSLILCFFFLVFTACENNSGKSANDENKEQEKTIYIKPQSRGFGHAAWRIDSVAENNVVIGRPFKDPDIQIFHFEKDGTFSTMLVKSSGVTQNRPIGKWKLENDSVFITNNSGDRAMNYGFEMKGPVLILHGNFEVSSSIKKKPTFYLSKYVEK